MAERAVECCTGHRQAAITHNVFRACDGAAAPKVLEMLEALRGRTIVFLGDSTMHQLWTALVAEIFRVGQPIDVTQRVLEFDLRPQNHNRDDMCTVSHTNQARIGGCENNFRLHRHRSPMCNHTGYQGGKGADGLWQLRPQCLSIPDLELSLPEAGVRFKFFRMDNNKSKTVRAAWQRTHAHCQTAKKNFEDKIRAAAKAGDAVIANIGVWYGHEARQQYRADVDYVLSQLQALPAGKLGLYRESVVQHFPTLSGSGLFEERSDVSPWAGGGRRLLSGFGSRRAGGFGGALGGKKCHRQCADLGAAYADKLDWRNQIVHELVEARGFPRDNVVPVASLLRPMAAAHKNTKWQCTLDCTHYCYHPDLWAALLDGVYRRLIRWSKQSPHDTDSPSHASGGGGGGASAGRRRGARRGGKLLAKGEQA